MRLAIIPRLLAAGFMVAVLAQAPTSLAGPLALEGPVGPTLADKAVFEVPAFPAAPVDEYAARAEDSQREAEGLPPRFALPEDVFISPATDGVWDDLDDEFRLWRLRITSEGALSLNFGFTGFQLPKGARLGVYPADYQGLDDPRGVRVFDERDNEDHGELWTPVVLGDDVVIELLMPVSAGQDYLLELTRINRGYRFFGEDLFDKSGSCNIDVVCPEGDDWRSEIPSVGVISTGGSTFCSGVMMNNTAEDGTPYFLTANHCGIGTSNDQSLVVYWNFESPACGQQGGGTLDQFNTGSLHLASGSTSDFTLVRLDDPVNPDYGVTYAGWDRSDADPDMAVAIHHPSTDEKSISFEYDPTTTTSYLSNSVPGNGSHIRVIDWDEGTTEPGSSGSPLFNASHQVVGQLHGGYASCTSQTSDWYGRLSVSFPSIADWLDPLDSGAMTVNTLDPAAIGLRVTPGSGLMAEGNAGGPFTPSGIIYTLENQSETSLQYQLSSDVAWVDLSSTGGILYVGDSAEVTVSLNGAAEALPIGLHSGTIQITNLTDGEGNTTRPVNLQVGVPEMVYSFDMSSDPGWTTEGQWEWGVPAGNGGADHGNEDPTSGATGNYVIGYNLAGDYTNNMAETHLTSTAIDCSDLSAVSVKFQRWLNVERPAYDHAYVRVSTDGNDWTTVWENGEEITDSAWSEHEFDLSAIADGAETLYLRWTMGTTDGSWLYSGWNIDDVEIWGLAASDLSAAGDLPTQRLQLGNHPNPFNPSTKVSFSLAADGPASLNIYNVQGQLVRRLLDDRLVAGAHQVTWDGRTDEGRTAGSGVYFARLVSGAQVIEHKMVLLK